MNGIFFFLQVYLPGLAIYFLIQKKIRVFDLFFVSIVTGALFNTFIILALTALRSFTPINWIYGVFTCPSLLAILCFLKLVRGKPEFEKIHIKVKETAILILILGLFFFFFSRPTEYVLHTMMDNTQYMTQAGFQLETGTLFMENNQFQKYTDDFPNAKYQLSSFDGYPREDGLREIHFPPLWRMTLAMPLYWGGLSWAVYSCFVISILSGLFFWRWIKDEFSDSVIAPLGMAVLILTPVFFHYSKLQMSEPLMVLYVIVGFYLLQRALHFESRGWAALAAVFLSSAILVKADSLMLIPTLICLPIFLLLSEKENKFKTILYFGLINSLLNFLFFLIINYISREYYIQSYNALFLEIIRYCSLLYSVLFALLLYSEKFKNTFLRFLQNVPNYWPSGLINVGFVLMLFFILIRQPEVRDWVKAFFPVNGLEVEKFFFPTYVIYPFIGLPLLIAGSVGLWLVFQTKNYRVISWLSVFLFISFMSLYDAFHSMSLFWAARRYLTSLLPLLVISFVFLFKYLRDSGDLGRKLATVTALTVLICAVAYDYASKDQFKYSDPIIKKLDRFARKFPEKSVYFVDGERDVALSLQLAMKYYYGQEALNPDLKTIEIPELVKFVRKKMAEGKTPLITLPDDQFERLSGAFTLRKLFNYKLGYFKNPVVTVYSIVPKINS
jgi:hypothetical protein